MLACLIDEVKIEQGVEYLTHYEWNTKVATHHLWSNCGIMTHHRRRTTPEIFGVKVCCMDEVGYRGFQDAPMEHVIDLTLVEK